MVLKVRNEIVAVLLLCLCGSSCRRGPAALFPVKVDGKWGYIDTSGKLVIKPQFHEAREFSDGLAVVEVDKKKGYIDTKGRVVVAPGFASAWDFHEGLAAIAEMQDLGQDLGRAHVILRGLLFRHIGACGFIDERGNYVIPPGPFCAAKLHGEDPTAKLMLLMCRDCGPMILWENFHGYPRAAGIFLFSPRFTEGLAIAFEGGKAGYVDKSGKFAIPARFDDVHSFSEGLAVVVSEGKAGYIDHTGTFVIPAQFDVDGASAFSEGLAAAARPGPSRRSRWGYIDKTGTWVVKPQFDEAKPFSDGLACVGVGGKPEEIDSYYFIDRSGKRAFAGDFRGAESFSEGMARVRAGEEKWGYVDKSGKLAIPFRYDSAEPFSHGLAAVKVGDRLGYVDKTGNYVWNPTQ